MKLKIIKGCLLIGLVSTLIIANPIKANASWRCDYGDWFYEDSNGDVTGWNKIDGKWYYFNTQDDWFESKGQMKTGWFKDIDNKWYYLSDDGSMLFNTVVDGCKLDEHGVWIGNYNVNQNDNNSTSLTNGLNLNQQSNADITYKMTYDKIKNINDFRDYVKNEYSTLKTPLGLLKFDVSIYENDSKILSYYFDIDVDYGEISDSPYGLYSFSPYDLEYSIKISDDDKEETIRLLKDYQRKLADMFIDKFPGKKIQGGFHSSGYKYSYIREGYWSTDFCSWNNFDVIDEDEIMDYNNTEVSSFQWDTDYDDYDFVNY